MLTSNDVESMFTFKETALMKAVTLKIRKIDFKCSTSLIMKCLDPPGPSSAPLVGENLSRLQAISGV